MKFVMVAAAALLGSASVAGAAQLNFLEASNAGAGKIGESIYDSFNTSTDYFGGPAIEITAFQGGIPSATNTPTDAYVYFDNGDAGMGVCASPNAAGTAALNTNTGGSANLCSNASDDSIQDIYNGADVDEFLMFKSVSQNIGVDSIWVNANHDAQFGAANSNSYTVVTSIGGSLTTTSYTGAALVSDPLKAGSGDYKIDLGIVLGAGDFFYFKPEDRPHIYVSAIEANVVPLPASALLLIGGMGGLAALRRVKRKRS